ncbi:MAG: nuclear transport factor 2 family protein [Acidobacteria bacterium]|nr:nuclear transport factor 2 family protein [Acidobacteriota bacterium]
MAFGRIAAHYALASSSRELPCPRVILLSAAVLFSGCACSPPNADVEALEQQVLETERAFARTMAARDHAAFTSFLSDEAIFFSGDEPLRGSVQVADWWRRYFEAPDAPFSWEPERVEVLDSGTLALSTGRVRDPDGALIGTFTSIWRREPAGEWRIIFDKGSPACNCPSSP